MLSDFLHDLRQLEKAAPAQHGTLILEAFRRHTQFAEGAVYFRERDALRLAAKTESCDLPDAWNAAEGGGATLTLALRTHRDDFGIIALTADSVSDDDLELARTAEAFLGTVIANHRLMQETREGDFQLKYRLWELESLYDIGLSIASTLNIDELADEILFRMISLTNARRGALFLREGVHFRPYRTFADLEVEASMLDRVLAERRPITNGTLVAVPIKGNNEIIGVLAAADVFTESVTFWVMESLRLNVGYGSRVRP